jgi:DNA ligase (NAD+)
MTANLTSILSTHSGSLEMLWNLGFKSPGKKENRRVVQGIQPVIDHCLAAEAGRDHLDLRDRWHGSESE